MKEKSGKIEKPKTKNEKEKGEKLSHQYSPVHFVGVETDRFFGKTKNYIRYVLSCVPYEPTSSLYVLVL